MGRNQPCWCGSGEKYKRCHLNREEGEEIKPWEIEHSFKKAFGAKYCSVPNTLKNECNGNVVRAHSVSKSMNLKKIERNGHVYAFIPSIKNLIKCHGLLRPELYGINKASTFTGFCAYHDKQIFLPLEDQEFVGSKEQCFLLAYRAHAREHFTKKCSSELLDFIKQLDRGESPLEQIYIQNMASAYSSGTEAGVRDGIIYNNKLEAILTTRNFTNINAYIINFKKTPSVLCSAGIFPEYDFYGNHLQDVFDLEATHDLLTFSTIVTKNGGAAVFTWLNDIDSKGNCEKFINSLKAINQDKITSSLIRFFFEFCENIFMEPKWWESLEKSKQDSLISRVLSAAFLLEVRNANCLCDDNLSFDDWELINTREIK